MICCRRARRNHIVNSRVEAAKRNDQRQMLLSTWKPSVIIISWKPIFFMLHWQRGDDRIIQFIQCDYYILYRCVVCNLCVLNLPSSRKRTRNVENWTLCNVCGLFCLLAHRHVGTTRLFSARCFLFFLPSSLAHSAKCVWKCFIKLTQTISHLRPTLWYGGGKWQTWWNEKEKLISTAMVILMIVTYWEVPRRESILSLQTNVDSTTISSVKTHLLPLGRFFSSLIIMLLLLSSTLLLNWEY